MKWLYQYARTSGLFTKGRNEFDIPVANFGVVVPGKIYRSAAPSTKALVAMDSRLGLRWVLDLRNFDSPSKYAESLEPYVGENGQHIEPLSYNIPMDDHGEISEAQINEALNFITCEHNAPLLIHCQGGRHRTSLVVMAYRITVEGWTWARAYDEAKDFGWYSHKHEGVYRAMCRLADREGVRVI